MGKTDPSSSDALIPSPKRDDALEQRQQRLGELSLSYAARAASEALLEEQAKQMHAAIEATRQQLAQNLHTLHEETHELREDVGKQLQETLQSAKERLTQAKERLDVRALVRAHPWPAVGLAFALGFYLAMD